MKILIHLVTNFRPFRILSLSPKRWITVTKQIKKLSLIKAIFSHILLKTTTTSIWIIEKIIYRWLMNIIIISCSSILSDLIIWRCVSLHIWFSVLLNPYFCASVHDFTNQWEKKNLNLTGKVSQTLRLNSDRLEFGNATYNKCLNSVLIYIYTSTHAKVKSYNVWN